MKQNSGPVNFLWSVFNFNTIVNCYGLSRIVIIHKLAHTSNFFKSSLIITVYIPLVAKLTTVISKIKQSNIHKVQNKQWCLCSHPQSKMTFKAKFFTFHITLAKWGWKLTQSKGFILLCQISKPLWLQNKQLCRKTEASTELETKVT